MLAVVEDNEHAPARKRPSELRGACAFAKFHAGRRRDRWNHEGGVRNCRQVNPSSAVAESLEHLLGHRQGQARLSHAASADDGNKATRLQPRVQRKDVLIPPQQRLASEWKLRRLDHTPGTARIVARCCVNGPGVERPKAKHMHRLRDIANLVHSVVIEPQVWPAGERRTNHGGHGDSARFGQRLDACRHVDAVSIDGAVGLLCDIAQVDTDAVAENLIARKIPRGFR
jgi:hypothetical protein